MINWIKYDPENPPEENKLYLTFDDEGEVNKGYYAPIHDGRYFFSNGNGALIGVTHYAVINLPGEETTE